VSSVVVKLGGHALDSLDPTSAVLQDLAADVADLHQSGINVVIVHGGGPQIATLLSSTGIKSRFHEGLRITDDLTMSYVTMALCEVNTRIVAALNTAGLASVGVSGADDSLLLSSSLGEPWMRAGSTPKVRYEFLESLWNQALTPVMSSVAIDADGRLLNCNADTAAGAVAAALGASVLLLLSDIDQLRSNPDDPSTAVATASSQQVRDLVESGAARDGMRPKMAAALDALDGGAVRILMANGTRRHALRDALAGSIPTTEVVR
jgi:acetylglutamate kinase